MIPWYSSQEDLAAKCEACIVSLKALPRQIVIPSDVPVCDSTVTVRVYDVFDDAADLINESAQGVRK